MDIQDLAQLVPIEEQIALESIDFVSDGDEFLTFCLGHEHYGVDILSVKEIRGWETPTLIPNAPDYVKGVINIRGIIIPIIDLRIRFGFQEVSYLPTTVVIVLASNGEHSDSGHNNSAHNNRMIGFVVDAVSDVLNADSNDIKPSPAFGGRVPSDTVRGLVNVQDNVVTILALEQLLVLEGD